MNLDTVTQIISLFSMLVVFPVAVFKVWRRLDERLTEQDKKLERIDAQFHRNGGSTLRDQNDRMERDLARLTGRFDQHIEEGK